MSSLQLLGMGDLQGLMEKVSEIGIEDQKELMDKISHGVFTLRDMYEQFQNIQKLGPFGQVMVSTSTAGLWRPCFWWRRTQMVSSRI